jgi:hypothetical protein
MGDFHEDSEAIFLGSVEEFVEQAYYLGKRYEDLGRFLWKVSKFTGEVRFGEGSSRVYPRENNWLGPCFLEVHIPLEEWEKVKIGWSALKHFLKIAGGPPTIKIKPEIIRTDPTRSKVRFGGPLTPISDEKVWKVYQDWEKYKKNRSRDKTKEAWLKDEIPGLSVGGFEKRVRGIKRPQDPQ